MLNPQTSQVLLDIFDNVDVFMLAFARVLGLTLIMPVFSGRTVPNITKIGFSLSIAVLAMLNGNLAAPPIPDDFFAFFAIIVSELAVGFIIGFVIYFMLAVFYFVGQLMDYQIGFSMVSVYDPLSQIQAPVTGNFYYLVYLVFIVVSGAFHRLILVFFESFSTISLGRAFILGNGGLAGYLTGMLTGYFELGFKIALPIIGTIIVVDVALGVLVKAVPQMNVFVVGLPLKLLIGLAVLYIMAPYLGDTFEEFFKILSTRVSDVIGLLSS